MCIRKLLRREDTPVVAVVDADEFERAQRDPRVRAFLEEADAYLARLEREGRSLPETEPDGHGG